MKTELTELVISKMPPLDKGSLDRPGRPLDMIKDHLAIRQQLDPHAK